MLGDTECDILVDTGTSRLYISKSYFFRCKSLHSWPKFTSTTTRIQVGNGQYEGVLFVISIIMTIQKHRFEIFTLVSEIHENVDLVIGIKNLFELEGVIDSWDSCVSFLNRSIPFLPREKVSVKQKEQKLVVLEAPFVEEISGMAITKNVRCQRIENPYNEIEIHKEQGNIQSNKHYPRYHDIGPNGNTWHSSFEVFSYYKIKQGVIQQNLSCMYHLESANTICD